MPVLTDNSAELSNQLYLHVMEALVNKETAATCTTVDIVFQTDL